MADKDNRYYEDEREDERAGQSYEPADEPVYEDEAAQGVAAVKNMATGEQLSLTPEAAAAHINAALEGRRRGRVIVG